MKVANTGEYVAYFLPIQPLCYKHLYCNFADLLLKFKKWNHTRLFKTDLHWNSNTLKTIWHTVSMANHLTVSHLQFSLLWTFYILLNWGEPERPPHLLKSVMVSYVACTDCENDKIWFTSHSSFVMVSYIVCTDCENNKIRFTSHSSFVMISYVAFTNCENDKIQWTSYSAFHTSRVQTMSVEGSMKWGKRGLDGEENMTDVKREKLMKKDKQGL